MFCRIASSCRWGLCRAATFAFPVSPLRVPSHPLLYFCLPKKLASSYKSFASHPIPPIFRSSNRSTISFFFKCSNTLETSQFLCCNQFEPANFEELLRIRETIPQPRSEATTNLHRIPSRQHQLLLSRYIQAQDAEEGTVEVGKGGPHVWSRDSCSKSLSRGRESASYQASFQYLFRGHGQIGRASCRERVF